MAEGKNYYIEFKEKQGELSLSELIEKLKGLETENQAGLEIEVRLGNGVTHDDLRDPTAAISIVSAARNSPNPNPYDIHVIVRRKVGITP